MKVLAVVGLVCLFCAPTLHGEEKPWFELRSPHFRLITNGNRDDAKEVLRHFELIRAVFASCSPSLKLDTPAQLTIIAAKDEKTIKALLPGFAARAIPLPGGMFRHGWEREYALVRLDVVNQDPSAYESIYHEYVHTLLHANFRWLPAWVDEGLAQFYGYTSFDGKNVHIGALPDIQMFDVLIRKHPIPLSEFIVSPLYTRDPTHNQLSYMQAWALIHFFMLSPSMESGQRLQRFIDALQKGADQKKAFEDSFGNFSDVERDYKRYIDSTTYPTRVGPAPASLNENELSVGRMEPGETEAELAAWFIRSHEWDSVRHFTQTALAENPKLSLAHEDNGFLLYNEGHDEEAYKEFSTASDLDSKNYIALFAKIMTSPAAQSTLAQDQQSMYAQLNEVVDLKPDFAPAYIELAKLNVVMGNPRVALAISRKAEQLEPFRAGYHILSGRILLLMNRPAAAAAAAAYVAQRWGGTDRDEAMELWNEIPETDRSQSVAASPVNENRGEAVEGKVISVSCNGSDFALTLDVAGQARTYKSKGFPVGFSDTLWVGHDHFTPCFHVDGLRVMLHYKPARDQSYAGDLIYAGFREDVILPRSASAEASAQK